MATSTGAFLAGIGTTFVVLAIGFGGGLMIAKSALKEPDRHQTRAASETLNPVRVILPTSAEAAQPPQQPLASSTPGPVAQLEAPKQKQAIPEKPDTRKPEVEEGGSAGTPSVRQSAKPKLALGSNVNNDSPVAERTHLSWRSAGITQDASPSAFLGIS